MNSDLLWMREEAVLNCLETRLHPEVVSSFAILDCRQDHTGKPARIHLGLKLISLPIDRRYTHKLHLIKL